MPERRLQRTRAAYDWTTSGASGVLARIVAVHRDYTERYAVKAPSQKPAIKKADD